MRRLGNRFAELQENYITRCADRNRAENAGIVGNLQEQIRTQYDKGMLDLRLLHAEGGGVGAPESGVLGSERSDGCLRMEP